MGACPAGLVLKTRAGHVNSALWSRSFKLCYISHMLACEFSWFLWHLYRDVTSVPTVRTAEDYVIMYPLFSGNRAKNDQLRVLSKFKVSRHIRSVYDGQLRLCMSLHCDPIYRSVMFCIWNFGVKCVFFADFLYNVIFISSLLYLVN
jgi:hypothetical protein